jgi:RNA polymerase sigma-70 factor (ECF subfamily)
MDADPVDGALRHELQSGMMAALMTLSMSHRLVLTLYYFEAMGYEEIATVVGFPVGTVKTHLHRAKAAMRRAMQAKELV